MFHLKGKQPTFFITIRRMTTEDGARAVGILGQGAGLRQKIRFPENPGLLLTNVAVYDKPNRTSSFSGRQSFRTPAFNDRWPIQTGNVIDTYCCSIPTAFALCYSNTPYDNGNVVCFSFSEAFSN